MPCSRAAVDAARENRRLCRARGWIGVVTAFAAADRVGAAGIVRLGAQRVVLALAIGRADRMDRRQIKDVEAHVPERRQARDDVVECAMASRLVGARAGKQLVPGRERACGRSTSSGKACLRRQLNSRSSASSITSRRSRVRRISTLSSAEALASHCNELAMAFRHCRAGARWLFRGVVGLRQFHCSSRRRRSA